MKATIARSAGRENSSSNGIAEVMQYYFPVTPFKKLKGLGRSASTNTGREEMISPSITEINPNVLQKWNGSTARTFEAIQNELKIPDRTTQRDSAPIQALIFENEKLRGRVKELEEKLEEQANNERLMCELMKKIQYQDDSLKKMITSLGAKDFLQRELELKLLRLEGTRTGVDKLTERNLSTKVVNDVQQCDDDRDGALLRRINKLTRENQRLTLENNDASNRMTMMKMQIAALERKVVEQVHGQYQPAVHYSRTSTSREVDNRANFARSNKKNDFEASKTVDILMEENITLKMKITEMKKDMGRNREGTFAQSESMKRCRSNASIGCSVPVSSSHEISAYYETIISRLYENTSQLLEENERLNLLLNKNSPK